MLVPESLAYKRELFTKTGRIAMLEHETFLPASWLAIYAGLHVWPQRYEPIVDILVGAELNARLEGMREIIRRSVETLPAHATFLNDIVICVALALRDTTEAPQGLASLGSPIRR